MSLRLGDTAPDFAAVTTEGPIKFHDWVGDDWAILFSHPHDFTPVCTTELGYVARLTPEFEKRGVKTIGLSIDPVTSHQGWLADIMGAQSLPRIAAELVGHGRSPDTPVALIRWGTTEAQEVMISTLGAIVTRARAARVAPPMLAIIGEVVRLRERLAWFETHARDLEALAAEAL